MKTRQLLSRLLGAGLFFFALQAQAFNALDYTPGLIKQRIAAGETVLVDYYTTWCSTCAAQGRAISALMESNPNYEKHITFIKVDWDKYANHEVSTSRNIPRRSSLVLLRGEDELGRLIAVSNRTSIKNLLDRGLQ